VNYNVPNDCQVKELNAIYLKYFGYRTTGFFVEVGAYDGVRASNTWGLAEAGWGGIYIEPVQQFYDACVINHKNHLKVKSYNCCIGKQEGEVPFYLANTLSTYNIDYLNSDYWKAEYANAQRIMVHTTTLDKFLKENNAPTNFEVLVVDVEGAESDVLEKFDIDYWQPKMCIIESQELHPAKELSLQAPFINNYFKVAGYNKIYCDEINSIYIRGEENK
jgi:FkbM family methyltransferase